MEQQVIKSNVLLPFIEDSYRKEYAEYSRQNLRCSDAGAAADQGDKCERQIYYDMKMWDKKSLLSTESLVMFDDGRLHEGDIRRRLVQILRSPEREVMDKETGAKGKIDNMVSMRFLQSNSDANGTLLQLLKSVFPTGAIIEDPVLEIKSVNEYSFQDMAATQTIKQSYYDQVQYYLYLLDKKWAIIVIKNRNSSGPEKGALPFLEFIILADKARQAQIVAGLLSTKECIEKEILPPRPFLRESTQCVFCRYKHICWPPKAEPPTPILQQEKIEVPSQEILESAIRLYHTIDKEILEKANQLEEAKSVILRFFKATKKEEIIIGNIKASYSTYFRKYLDPEVLVARLTKTNLLLISDLSAKKLNQAIADRKIDAGIIEEAQKFSTRSTETLRITELKEKTGRLTEEQIKKAQKKEKRDDKRDKRSKKASTSRPHKTWDKKSKPKKQKRIPGRS